MKLLRLRLPRSFFDVAIGKLMLCFLSVVACSVPAKSPVSDTVQDTIVGLPSLDPCTANCGTNSMCSGKVCYPVECSGPSIDDPVWGYVMYFDKHVYGCKEAADEEQYAEFKYAKSLNNLVVANAIIPIGHGSTTDGQQVAVVAAFMGAHGGGCPWTDGPGINWHIMVESLDSTLGSDCLSNSRVVLQRELLPNSQTFTVSPSQVERNALPFVIWISQCDGWGAGALSLSALSVEITQISMLGVDFSSPPDTWPDEVPIELCGLVDTVGPQVVASGADASSGAPGGNKAFGAAFILKKRKFTALWSACYVRPGDQFARLWNCWDEFGSK